MNAAEKDKKIIDGAVQILRNPDSFCKGSWFKERGRSGRFRKDIDPTYIEGWEDLQDTLEESGASLANPNYQVCGQGAIYVSASIQGFSHGDACRVIENIEYASGCSIPGVNDAKPTTVDQVIELIACPKEFVFDPADEA